MHEGGETDAALFAVVIFASETFALRVVIGEFQRAIEQAVHIDALANHLARRGCLAFLNEVALAKLLRRKPDCACDFIHLTLESEDALRRAKTPKRAMRWNVCRQRLTVNAHVRTEIRTGGVNRAARQYD